MLLSPLKNLRNPPVSGAMLISESAWIWFAPQMTTYTYIQENDTDKKTQMKSYKFVKAYLTWDYHLELHLGLLGTICVCPWTLQ